MNWLAREKQKKPFTCVREFSGAALHCSRHSGGEQLAGLRQPSSGNRSLLIRAVGLILERCGAAANGSSV